MMLSSISVSMNNLAMSRNEAVGHENCFLAAARFGRKQSTGGNRSFIKVDDI